MVQRAHFCQSFPFIRPKTIRIPNLCFSSPFVIGFSNTSAGKALILLLDLQQESPAKGYPLFSAALLFDFSARKCGEPMNRGLPLVSGTFTRCMRKRISV